MFSSFSSFLILFHRARGNPVGSLDDRLYQALRLGLLDTLYHSKYCRLPSTSHKCGWTLDTRQRAVFQIALFLPFADESPFSPSISLPLLFYFTPSYRWSFSSFLFLLLSSTPYMACKTNSALS
ncbi:hypothetical protein FRC19_007206 [Serendipita sp. 401]|nr:hypothetical protein FRC19_007206 [Serendipita sp. 401]